jgi:hypothetical protein
MQCYHSRGIEPRLLAAPFYGTAASISDRWRETLLPGVRWSSNKRDGFPTTSLRFGRACRERCSMRVAILDDYQNEALAMADWSGGSAQTFLSGDHHDHREH